VARARPLRWPAPDLYGGPRPTFAVARARPLRWPAPDLCGGPRPTFAVARARPNGPYFARVPQPRRVHLTWPSGSPRPALKETPLSQQTADRTRTFAELFDAVVANVGAVIQGKTDVIRLVVLAMVAEGHVLIEDAPGTGKTSMAKALGRSIEAEVGRIQFTPDLLPTDVVGLSVWNRSNTTFEFRPGPVFAGIVLADEINRASPKTQSALLEAMAEGQVTVDGTTHRLRRPFMVLATQNPLDHEGTYPLPESQLDRFLMKVSMGYPSREAELQILTTHATDSVIDTLQPVVSRAEIQGLIAAAQTVHVAPPVQHYLVELADASRRHRDLALGMSTRATLSLQRVTRALAAAQGREFVTPDDVKVLAHPVLDHRLVVNADASLRGVTTRDATEDILSSVPVPRMD
jgi:MoxR-like ATPase